MDPRRLGEYSRVPFERTLLESAKDDGPSPEARRALAALAAGMAGTAATRVARHGLASLWGGKGVVIVGLAALGVGVLWWGLRSHAPAAAVAPRATVAVPSPPASTAEANAIPTDPPAPPLYAVDDLPVAAPAMTTHVAETAGSAPQPPEAVSDLAAERALVERARAALAGGDARTALTALDEYDQRFPRGLLRDEADVTRIDALAKSGRLELARSRAKAFLATRGDGPYALRVSSFLESTAEGAP
jgi:hypothetical protein